MPKKVIKKEIAASKATNKNTTAPESNKNIGKDTLLPAPPTAIIIGKSYLSETELEHFRTLLVHKLKQLTGDVSHLEDGSLRKSRQDATGDLSSMPIHMADLGSDTYEQEFSLGLMDTERKIVQEIMAALNRIDKGVYGMCEGTGDPIPKARLEAFPWARYCVRFAEKKEKSQTPQ